MNSPTTYMDQKRLPLPFCPGCSHSKLLHDLDAAMVKLALDPAKTVIVTDIGCSGLSDQWFNTHAFHGLHGRSMTYAEGIKLSDPSLHDDVEGWVRELDTFRISRPSRAKHDLCRRYQAL